MRMTNDRDQGLLRSAVADTAANFLAFLPSLGTGEAFAFGEGVALPTRMKFRQLPAQLLPKSETVTPGESTAATDNRSLAAVVERWRGRVAKPRSAFDKPAEETRQPPLAPAEAPQLQPQAQPQLQSQPQSQPAALDPNRFKLLKRPLDPAVPDPLRR
jgi:hypothetical protein